MGSSLLIHNTGLPFPIIISFLYLLGSITIGWTAIWFHARRFQSQLWSRIQGKISQSNDEVNIAQLIASESQSINAGKKFIYRFVSLKTLHGMLMTFSWYQMLGRLVVTNPGSWDGCWTYPAYKCASGSAVFVNGTQAGYFPIGENNFLLLITIPAVVLIVFFAILYSFCASRHLSVKRNEVINLGPISD
jgi:hypothetical protein